MSNKRPQRPSADGTRDKILKAATQLFMRMGFAGTSMSALAEKANINQTLIFHHFGNKQKLWTHVKAAMITDISATSVSEQPASLQQFIDEVIQQRLAIYADRPELRKLIGWQKLEIAKSKHAIMDIPTHELSPSQWVKPIKYLQSQKQLNATINPALLISWLVASVDVVIDDDMGHFKQHPNHKEAYLKMLRETLQRGLTVML